MPSCRLIVLVLLAVVLVTSSSLSFCSPTPEAPPPAPGPMPEWNSSIALNATDLISACSTIGGKSIVKDDDLLTGFSPVKLPDVDATTIAKVAVKYFADPSSDATNNIPSPGVEVDPATDDNNNVSANAIAAPIREEILACAPSVELAMKSVDVTEACRKEIDTSVQYIVQMDVVFTCTSSITTVPGQTYSFTMVSLVSILDGEPLTVQKIFISNRMDDDV